MNELNNNVIETVAEEAVVKAPNKVLVGCGAAGMTLLIGGLAYKFVIKPLTQKAKAKKELKCELAEEEDIEDFKEEE